MIWNFKPRISPSYISVSLFSELHHTSDVSIYTSPKKESFTKVINSNLMVNENYFFEFHERLQNLINYSHAIYYALSYGYNLSDSEIVNLLIKISHRNSSTWRYFLSYSLFTNFVTRSFININYQEMVVEFLKIGTYIIYHEFIKKGVKPINDYDWSGI